MLKFISPPLRLTLALLGASLLAAPARAQTTPARDYSPSDDTAEILPKYREVVEAKNYPAALAILDAQLAKVPADSYDAAMLNQIKAQTLLQKGDFPGAVAPLEKGLALSDAKTPTFYDERTTRELVYFLASLYFQEAVQSKDFKYASSQYEKADKSMARWLKLTPKTTPEAQLIYAQLLYNWGVQNPEHPNLEIIKRALEQTEIGLHLSARPKDILYVFKMACLQQLNRNEDVIDVLELLIQLKPDTNSYWQQLAALYLQDERPLRAIVTIERAQAHGYLQTPKDNYNLIGIYFNLGYYGKSAELLDAGLKSGHVENDIKNWELLALAYQQLERPFKGIEALKDATKSFPKSGQLEFMIAQAYNALDKPEDALPHLQAAVTKGGLTKPYQVYLFLAYISYQLKKYDIALDAAKHAIESPEGSKEGHNMLKAIEDVIKYREDKKNRT